MTDQHVLSSDLPPDPLDIYRQNFALADYYLVVDPLTGERRFLEWSERVKRPVDTERSVFYGPYNTVSEAVSKSNSLGVSEDKKPDDTAEKLANDFGCWLGLIFVVAAVIFLLLIFT